MTTLVRDSAAARTIVGYCWPWTVRPGQQIDFMVSCDHDGPYRADLVRIICADDLSSPGMFKEREMDAPFKGDHPGRLQQTHLGSYVEVPPRAVLDGLKSFTVQAMVFPTLLPQGVRARSGGVQNSWEDPVFEEQHLVSRWDKRLRQGWALLIDETGRPAFMVGHAGKVERVLLDRPLIQDKWFLLTGAVSVETGELHVAARAAAGSPGDLVAWPEKRQRQRYSPSEPAPQAGPLRFAACTDGHGNGPRLKQAYCFSGRLDRVRLTRGVIELEQASALSSTTIPPALHSRVVGFWDFAQNMERVEVMDASTNALHGTTVNLPTRAVRGVDWDGSATDWRERPHHYSAIHFHDDDLYDAEWQKDFSYTVPPDLPSGIYAARLRRGDEEDYVPFFVAPPEGQARAKAALLIPTLSYTAYTNVTGLTMLKRKRTAVDNAGATEVIEEDTHPCLLQDSAHAAYLIAHLRRLGKGLYANHTDGTLAGGASQRHPNMTTKPKGMVWTLVADTYLTDWLEHKQIPYDIITDDLLHAEGMDALMRYTVVMTGNHPEYYSQRMLDAVDQYERRGGRWMYLGGNGFYWVTSVHSQLPGAIEVRKDTYSGQWHRCELRHAFDGVQGGLWKDNGRAPQVLFGVGMDPGSGYCCEDGAAYKRLPGSYDPRAAFIFEGVQDELIGGFGLFGGGAAGQEMDAINPERGTPAHALHLARADSFIQYGSLIAEEYKINTRPPAADLVFFETPNGGAVFSVGSMSWVGALSHNDYDNDVSRITENVLRRFLEKTPFRFGS